MEGKKDKAEKHKSNQNLAEGHHQTTAISLPLSWKKARIHVRTVLEDYITTKAPISETDVYREKNSSKFAWFWNLDLDFYVAALPASVALLVLACLSFTARTNGRDTALNARARVSVYRTQIAAGSLLVAGTLCNIWLVRTRKNTCKSDGDVSKRNTISRFLRTLKPKDQQKPPTKSKRREPASSMKEGTKPPLSGTSMTDVYSTYRCSQNGSSEKGSWYQIPTLLLVKGDFVALQVGDVAPAECEMLPSRPCVTITGGERLTVESFGDECTKAMSSLPPGRTNLEVDSHELLTACNNKRIFVLKETPLEKFLRLPTVQQKQPQLHRQMEAIRSVLFLTACVVFVLAIVILFARPYTSDRDLSIILPIPFLAALGVLPTATHFCVFFLEVIGTARILVSVHPHALLKTLDMDESEQQSSFNRGLLLLRYLLATTSSRLSLQRSLGKLRLLVCCGKRRQFLNSAFDGVDRPMFRGESLIHVPPASSYLLEKLGVSTAFALVDDELACESHSSPQQLLIPSGKGTKLLDLCRVLDEEFGDGSDSEKSMKKGGRKSFYDSDSDSDDEQKYQHITLPSRRKLRALRERYRKRTSAGHSFEQRQLKRAAENDVQFEDPKWWQHLPSLKCIGLACLLIDRGSTRESDGKMSRVPSEISLDINEIEDEKTESEPSRHPPSERNLEKTESEKTALVDLAAENGNVGATKTGGGLSEAEKQLTQHIFDDRGRSQFQSLARCIGFSTAPNSLGRNGDISPFRELLRLRVISRKLLDERLVTDAHALGLEVSWSWGNLVTDSSSVVVQDRRSKGYQLLTVGHPRVVTQFCQEAWQGENLVPFTAVNKKQIVDTASNWSLADLDVAAFSYTPVPNSLERRLLGADAVRNGCGNSTYLLDNALDTSSLHHTSVSGDWSLMKNQIFLGVLGSAASPRKEIEPLLDSLDEAGVRFVYFSPRNMRRTKELASEVGIDVAWNCAISLRPLDDGEDDPHRMTSTYDDWDINAKLPHGIERVRQHLRDVDNVPLLVSLFTDVTKESTMQMVQIFQEYNDTVLSLGLSHLSRNSGIFAASDLAIGADIVTHEMLKRGHDTSQSWCLETAFTAPSEMLFVSAISSHFCAFNLQGVSSTAILPTIIGHARAALDASTSAGLFVLVGCLSFSLYSLFCVFSVSTSIPYVPTLGSALYLQVLLPLLGLSMAMSDAERSSMKKVPPKNDQSVTFGRDEGKRLYRSLFAKALAPSVLPQVLHLISFGELMIAFEPEFVLARCANDGDQINDISWVSLVRCGALREYSGDARTSSGSLVLAVMALCVVVSSPSFVYRAVRMSRESPWRRNHAWTFTVIVAIGLIAVYLAVSLEKGTFEALPWYFWLLSAIIPFVCLKCSEAIKSLDCKYDERAVRLRRLQFETKLGMWSPKA